MLSRLLQLVTGRQVEPSVEDAVERYRRDLEQVRSEIRDVEGNLENGLRMLQKTRHDEQQLMSAAENILLEIHDPLLLREAEQRLTGDSSTPWETVPIRLADGPRTLARITRVEDRTASTADDHDDDQQLAPSSATDASAALLRLRPHHFVFASDLSDEEDDVADNEEDRENPTAALVIAPSQGEARESAVLEPVAQRRNVTVVCLDEVRREDFSEESEFRRWQMRLGLLQQAREVESYVLATVKRDIASKREQLDAKLFQLRCQMIHLRHMEAAAVQQLDRSGIGRGREALVREEPPLQILSSAPA